MSVGERWASGTRLDPDAFAADATYRRTSRGRDDTDASVDLPFGLKRRGRGILQPNHAQYGLYGGAASQDVTPPCQGAEMSGATEYDILGLEPSADTGEVRAAYRRLSVRVHPDAGGTSALFHQVHNAYETLSEPGRRAAYDHYLGLTGPPFDPEPSTYAYDPHAAAPAADPYASGWPPGQDTDARPFISHSVPSWPARHPSVVVAGSGVLLTYAGFLTHNVVAVAGVVVMLVGLIGMLGSGRARAHEAALGPVPPTSAAHRFSRDLTFGIPMVVKFAFVAVAVLLLRSEFRRATGGRGR